MGTASKIVFWVIFSVIAAFIFCVWAKVFCSFCDCASLCFRRRRCPYPRNTTGAVITPPPPRPIVREADVEMGVKDNKIDKMDGGMTILAGAGGAVVAAAALSTGIALEAGTSDSGGGDGGGCGGGCGGGGCGGGGCGGGGCGGGG